MTPVPFSSAEKLSAVSNVEFWMIRRGDRLGMDKACRLLSKLLQRDHFLRNRLSNLYRLKAVAAFAQRGLVDEAFERASGIRSPFWRAQALHEICEHNTVDYLRILEKTSFFDHPLPIAALLISWSETMLKQERGYKFTISPSVDLFRQKCPTLW